MTEQAKVPAIRFAGFTDPWEQRKFSEIVDVCSGRDYKHLDEGPIPVYGTGGYMTSVSEALSHNRDAIGIGRKGTIDKPYLLKAPFWTVDTLFYAIPKSDINLEFALCSFLNVDWKSKDESTGLPSLSKESINETVLSVPNVVEQNHLGNFFADLDRLITLHQRKYDKLVIFKKSMLEKMFPKDGESVPEIRFAGFTDPWEQRKLGEVAHFINGRAYSQNELLFSGKYPVLRVGNFYTNDSWYYSNLELEDKNYAYEGDLLYTWSATFGPHIWHGNKVIYHYHIWKVQLEAALEKLFAFQLLERDKERILSDKNGSTMVHITKTGIENTSVLMSCSVEEQRRIGAFFDHLDSIITLHQRKLELLQNIKKSLLDKMFV